MTVRMFLQKDNPVQSLHILAITSKDATVATHIYVDHNTVLCNDIKPDCVKEELDKYFIEVPKDVVFHALQAIREVLIK